MGNKTLLRLMSVAATIFCMSTALAQTVNVTGKYIYHNDIQSPISDVKVNLVNATNQVVATTVTNSDGIYTFAGVPAGDYSVKASTDKASTGYNMQDCLTVLMYINGFTTLNSIQLLAADVDNNGVVDRTDFQLMVRAWGNPLAVLPAGKWKFESPRFTAKVTKTAEESDGTPDIPLPPSSGTSTGDVGSVYLPVNKPANTLGLAYVNTLGSVNSPMEIPIKVTSSVPATGFGLSIECPANFKIQEVVPSVAGLNITVNGQTIIANWIDANLKAMDLTSNTTLFVIKGTPTDGSTSTFTLGETSHLVSKAGDVVYTAKLELPKLALQNSDNFAFALKGNFPNPFAGSTKIVYTLPAAGNVEMKIFNIQGQLVATPVKGFQEAGLKELPFSGSSLQSGVYFCTISLKGDKNYTATSRMILAR